MVRLADCSYYGGVWRTVDHFAIEQSHQAFQVFDLVGRNSVEVAIPDRNVGYSFSRELSDLFLVDGAR